MIELSRETRERLLTLFAQFPPVAIQTEAQLEAVEEVVDHTGWSIVSETVGPGGEAIALLARPGHALRVEPV